MDVAPDAPLRDACDDEGAEAPRMEKRTPAGLRNVQDLRSQPPSVTGADGARQAPSCFRHHEYLVHH